VRKGEKKYKCGISGVRKKRIERKVPGKKSKYFWGGNFKVKIFVAVKS
jgi:hypothetical protein